MTKRITKSSIKLELKGLWNSTRLIHGFNVARVCWKTKSWMVIENEETFEDAAEDDFTPIEAYETQEELASALLRVINQ